MTPFPPDTYWDFPHLEEKGKRVKKEDKKSIFNYSTIYYKITKQNLTT